MKSDLFKFLIFCALVGVFVDRGHTEQESIQKWCNSNTGNVRYSNVGVIAEEFEPCGSLGVIALCDTTGHKFFGKGPAPEVYKDCSIGPRITISGTNVNRANLMKYQDSLSEKFSPGEFGTDQWDQRDKIEPKAAKISSPSNKLTKLADQYESYLGALDELLDIDEKPQAGTSELNKLQKDKLIGFDQLRELIGQYIGK